MSSFEPVEDDVQGCRRWVLLLSMSPLKRCHAGRTGKISERNVARKMQAAPDRPGRHRTRSRAGIRRTPRHD